MGRDKAMLGLGGRSGGRTLLGRGVDTLRAVPMLANTAGQVSVTVIGQRTALEGADHVIEDRYPGCGPLGGMEAALRDLDHSGIAGGMGDWAFFLPVDMPFLPAGLIDALLREWVSATERGARVCYAVVDGTPQPLVSLLHRSLHPFLVEALVAKRFKVASALEWAAHRLASSKAESSAHSQPGIHNTPVRSTESDSGIADWTATPEQRRLQRLWFSNLNTEEDLREAETLAALGPA